MLIKALYLVLIVIAFITLYGVDDADAHGRLLEPVARSSAWRKDSTFPAYYNDMEMFCGGAGTQWNLNGGKCGICGENYSGVKQFEKGGIYYTGRKVRTYNRGQVIDAHVELTANHLGWFEFRICNIDGISTDATQECLDQTLLSDINGLNRFPVQMYQRDIYFKLVLPNDLFCNHCVFQWKYNTSNYFGIAIEQFYGCSDVTIRNNGAPIIEVSETTSKPTTFSTTSTIVSTQTTTPTTTEKSSILSTLIPSSTAASSTMQIIDVTFSPSVQTTRDTTLETLNGSELCKNGDGFYPDLKTGCQKYYICVYSNTNFEKITYFQCSSGLLYDKYLKVCNYAQSVDCDSN